MGLSTEQTTAVLDSAAKLVEAAKVEPMPVTPGQSYWWWLSLAIIPVLLAWFLNRKKKP